MVSRFSIWVRKVLYVKCISEPYYSTKSYEVNFCIYHAKIKKVIITLYVTSTNLSKMMTLLRNYCWIDRCIVVVECEKLLLAAPTPILHDDIIKWRHFLHYWSFVRGIHQSPVNSPHKGQWHGAVMFSLICAWINGWVNNREAGVLRGHRTHYDVTVMTPQLSWHIPAEEVSWLITQQNQHCSQTKKNSYISVINNFLGKSAV